MDSTVRQHDRCSRVWAGFVDRAEAPSYSCPFGPGRRSHLGEGASLGVHLLTSAVKEL